MADLYRENQERHQDRERIEGFADQAQQAELPDHGCHRADQRQHRQLEAADVEPQQNQRHHQRHQEEQHDLYGRVDDIADDLRSEEHTPELQSLMRTSYAVFCLKKKINITVKLILSYTQTTSNTSNA